MRTAHLFVAVALGTFIAVPALADELLKNRTFDANTEGWWATQNVKPAVRDGRLCAEVPGKPGNPWDVIVGQNNVPLTKGESYSVSFWASGVPKGPIRALVQMSVDPYTSYVTLTPTASPEGSVSTATFTSPVTMPDAQIVFQVGGSREPWTLCLDDVSLTSGAAKTVYRPDTGSAIRVNQVGFLPDAPKRATLVTKGTSALPWQLKDATGATLLEGETLPRGVDPSAGVNVHTIDFSAFNGSGAGLRLSILGAESYPFAIDPGVYQALRIDALSYFYLVRSGIPILAEFVGPAYARPAGHVTAPGGSAINQGDLAVPCQAPASSQLAYGEPWTCGYTLDVTGGWYDAGDHGKYVVNGAISAAQLLATWERALTVSFANPTALVDGAVSIPERGNGTPDILDEARWELEFMLKMVVPDGQPLAGMVHHKVHGSEWTGIPVMPDADSTTRELHRPSTAATLGLAAVSAQAARLFRPYDTAFSERLLAAARSAWGAAVLHPDVYAPEADGNAGGGPYNDDEVADEFYWAAALFITTGEPAFHDFIVRSPHWASGEAFPPQGYDWAHPAALAHFDLATVPNGLSTAERAEVRATVVRAADRLLVTQKAELFGMPYHPPNLDYDWGSNHLVIQNAQVIAVAYDLTGDRKYRDGVLEAMDYIFGRNALNISYVTGYGTTFAQNMHSRWFAKQANADLPHPPRGSLAGGPNSGIEDPVAQRLFGADGCAPQACYVDDIESWSTNEIAINWNAALTRMASFLADQ